MASEGMVKVDKYRTFLHEDATNEDIVWRHGAPPTYDAVNKLFEEGRQKGWWKERILVCDLVHGDDVVDSILGTNQGLYVVVVIAKEWPKGSLEETVQNAIKSWEMELSHKPRLQDFRTINPDKFKLFVNGREGLSGEEALKIGSYNALLKTSLPKNFQYYKAEEESFESSHEVFRSALPRGFAWEVICVYSGPPNIAFKFRHWGYFEGPYKGHAPTGEMVEFYGLGVLKVDESLLVEDAEIYYDPAELFGGLLKGETTIGQGQGQDQDHKAVQGSGCPLGH